MSRADRSGYSRWPEPERTISIPLTATGPLRGTHWPEADRLFRSDPRWLGSDDAYSIPLEPDRTLWLFGDTFIAQSGTDIAQGGTERNAACLISNSIGIQEGADPSSATMRMIWGGTDETPAPAFAGGDGFWLWPLHGALVGEALLLFFMRVRLANPARHDPVQAWRLDGMLSFFDVFGWSAMLVQNPGDPSTWRPQEAVLPKEPAGPIAGLIAGAAVIEDDEFLLAYAWDPQLRLYLSRWPLQHVMRGDLTGPEWWCGTHDGWRRNGTPAVVIAEGATEFSVHRDAGSGRWVQVQMDSFPSARLRVRHADRPEGPWREADVAFQPEESGRDGVLCYAGKAHPQLSGGTMIATYASIADADATLRDSSIYYPRFVRLNPETR